VNTPNLNAFDFATAWTLRQAAESGKFSYKGKRLGVSLLQRWANPNKGRLPIGSQGPRVVLPSLLTGRERLVMPEWIDWFVAEVRRVMLAGCAGNGGVS
jgi:hypothetical protein